MDLILNTIQSFNRVALSDLDQVKLMDRIDHKYCLHRHILPFVLNSLKSHYSVLEILRQEISQYIIYEKIENLHADKKEELMADLKERTGINIKRIEVERIDFLRDTANITIFYDVIGTSRNNHL
jgi:hypothetical protein